MTAAVLSAVARTRHLDDDGARTWRVVETTTHLPQGKTAAILCDVWDRHWCPTAQERLAAMVPAMNELVQVLRHHGVLIAHAPSETLDFYATHPARARVLDAIRDTDAVAPPAPIDVPPLPVQVGATDGCDATTEVEARPVWTRQHSGIEIDDERDLISDNGSELASVFLLRGITTVVMIGVHTNMCVLNRSFGIKALVGYGFDVLLVRDLTDAMYDPADPPYVEHGAGTALVVEYIEKFLCGSVTSDALVASA